MNAAPDAQKTATALAPFWNALPDSHPAGARDIGAYRFYFADAQGQIAVGAYREDLEWFHGLLMLRYGPQIVTPLMKVLPGDSLSFFGRRRGNRAVRMMRLSA